MPHIAPKTRAAKSPFDINELLRLIAEADPPIRLMGIGGSNHEFNGLFSVMVDDESVERVVQLWSDAGYKDARAYGEPDGVHLDYAIGGQDGLLAPRDLLDAVNRGRRHHPGGVVSDITLGIMPITFWIDSNKDAVRDAEGYPVEDGSAGGDPNEAFPVQIYFLVPPGRDPDGNVPGN